MLGVEYRRMRNAVDIFEAELDCTEGGSLNATNTTCTSAGCEQVHSTFHLDSPGCQATIQGAAGHSASFESIFFGLASPVQCTNLPIDLEARRLIIAVGRLSTKGMYTNQTFEATAEVLTNTTTILVCRPKYTIHKSEITVFDTGILDQNDHHILSESSGSNLQPIPPWDLLEAFQSSVEGSSSLFRQLLAFHPPDQSIMTSFDMFFNLVQAINGRSSTTQLQDAEFLHKSSNRLFREVSAQIAKSHLMVPTAEEIRATCETTQQRLRIRGLSLYLMEAFLCFLIIETMAIRFSVLRRSASRSFGSIGGLATVLARSAPFSETMSGHGTSGLEVLKSVLSNFRCTSQRSRHGTSTEFRLVLLPHEDVASVESPFGTATSPRADSKWWRPYSKSPAFTAAVMATILLAIVGLEVAYWKSEASKGLADVELTGYIRYTWAYVPASVMVGIQLLVGTIGYSSLMILPYYRLRTTNTCTRQDILKDYLSKLNLQSIIESALKLEYLPLVISLYMFLSPFLTIAVSGLYTPQQVDLRETIPIIMDGFKVDSSLMPSAADEAQPADTNMGLPFLIGLLLRQDLSFPAWTYGDLVIPQLKIQPTPEPGSIQVLDTRGRTLEATVPAIQSRLHCSVVSGNPFNITTGNNSYWDDELHSDGSCNNTFSPSVDLTSGEPFGIFEANSWGIGAVGPNWTDPRVSSCPTAAGAFGPNLSTFITFTCSSVFEQVMTTTTFRLPSYSIVSASPNQSTAKVVSHNDLRSSYNGYLSAILPQYTDDFESPYSVLFQNLLADTSNATIASLLHPSNYDTVMSSIQSLYQLLMAQVFTTVVRPDPATNWTDVGLSADNLTSSRLRTSIATTGTLVNTDRYRLHQSLVSTRLLEGLLAAIFACLGVSWYLMPMRKKASILPKNPCSIAAAASLVAGSEVLEEVPAGAEWCSDAELERLGVWDGCVFRMGWWERGDTEGGGGVPNYGLCRG